MRCPSCDKDDISIGITREVPEQNSRIRTYKCNNKFCQKVIMTSEVLYIPAMRIDERDGSRPYLRIEWFREQLLTVANIYAPPDVEKAIFEAVSETCRIFWYKNKKKITRAALDKIVIQELQEKYPLLCIAYILKYGIIEKGKISKKFKQLLKQHDTNYAKEKIHARKLAIKRDNKRRARAKQDQANEQANNTPN